MALARQTFTANGSWTAPAGVNVVTIIGTAPLSPLASSYQMTAFIGNDNNVYTFGNNLNGQLGNGTVTPQSSPVVVLGGLPFSQLFASIQFGDTIFGVTPAGDMYSWGINTSGQLGVGDVNPRSSPVAVLGGFKWSSIYPNFNSSGPTYSVLGLNQAGAAYGWGFNGGGQLGIGNLTNALSSPTAVLGGLAFKQLLPVGSGLSYLGLTTVGAAYGWGSNSNGQLGVGDVNSRSSPVAVLEGLTFAQLFCDTQSASTVYGLTSSGTLYSWGQNTFGQLGVGDVNPRSSPVVVLGGLTFKTVSSASGSTVALSAAGAAYGWGSNSNGQLGVGDVNPRSSPVAVLGGLTFSSIVTLTGYTFGLTTAGALYAWGGNSNGQLGVGDVTPRSSPVAVLGGLTFSSIQGNGGATALIATTTGGQIYSWGAGAHGELGTGTTSSTSSPVAILGGHYPLLSAPQVIKKIPVVPGTAYAITTANPMGYFGTTQIGPMLNQIVVEYEQ